MALPKPEPGLVIGYSYLWHSEKARGREEGVKDRPCAIVLASRRDGGDLLVTVVPITHSPPESGDEAVEIPSSSKLRLGLDAAPSWIIVAEINRFVWPGTDLRPISRTRPDRFVYGLLPPKLFQEARSKLVSLARARRLRAVDRDDG